MKLKKLIPYIDYLANIKLFVTDDGVKDNPSYVGSVFDIPWHFIDYYLDDRGDEPISVWDTEITYPDGSKKMEPCLYIFLRENKDEHSNV